MADTWYVEYSFKQHVTFHEGFKTICVVPCRPLLQLAALLPAGKMSLLDSFPTTNEPR